MISRKTPKLLLYTVSQYLLFALLLPILISTFFSACQNADATYSSRYNKILADGGNEQFHLQLAANDQLPGLQLRIEVLQEISYPNVLIFVSEQPSKHPMADEDAHLLGRIDGEGPLLFIISRELSREKKLTITLFDGVHPILIRQFNLKK